MEFRLLGRLEVEADGVDLTPVRPKQRALLALLLLHAAEVVPIDYLLDALWGERPPDTARTALHGHVSTLRKLLGAERIETRAPGYVLRLADEDLLDIRRFERLGAEARSGDAAARAEKLRDALALFRGEPLADFRYESFARQESLRLDELRLSALEEKIAAELELGRHGDVISQLERLVAEHPLRERFRAELMLALYRAGRQADALNAFQEARRVLVAELGIEPGLSLQRLERQILNHDPTLAGVATKPTGVVTFLAADRPRDGELLHAVAARHGGFEVETRNSFLLVAFARARDAVAAAVDLQRAEGGDGIRVGIDSAEATSTATGYAGLRVRDASSICSAAHRGQVLVSQSTRDLLRELPPDEIEVRDIGKHRLNDLGPSRRLFQLVVPGLRADFPPVRSLETRPTNLPLQPAPLVGREREIAEVAGLLRRDENRLVTLTGAGGTGKTRLAAQVGALLLDDFADGVFFVDLVPLTDPGLVLDAAARSLGVRMSGVRTVAEDLARHLQRGRFLLVLDNFEHVLDAAPAVADIAAAAPAAKLLVTSRAPLRLAGERVFPVLPLATPDGGEVDTLLQFDSVALFVARAQAARPEFALTAGNASDVAGICTALDGLPLAIELAAPRVAVLPPDALLARLGARLKLLTRGGHQLPERHRALRTTIEWSYDLLEPQERKLFARLAAFAGGCSLEAVERVCGDDLDPVAGLSALVDASLLRVEGSEEQLRFAMLETIREYATERLEQSKGAEAVRRRHAEHFLALAEEAEPHLRGSPGAWLDRLEREHDNLHVALDRLDSAGEYDLALRLAGALWRFWYLKGRTAEGWARLERALAADERPTLDRGKALIGAAVLAVNRGDTTSAKRRAAEGIELHRALGDAWGAAYSRFMLGAAVGDEGDLDRAVGLDEESARLFRELGDEHSAMLATRNLARMYAALGDRRRARELYEANLRGARVTGNQRIAASSLGALGMIAVEEGRVEDAYPMLTESLTIHRDLGDVLDSAVDVCRVAFVLAFDGHGEMAARLLASFEAHADEIGGRRAWVADINDETLTTIRTQLDEIAFAKAWKQGRRLTVDEAVTLAIDRKPRA